MSGFSSAAYLQNATQDLVLSGADRTVLFVGQATSVGGAYFTFRLGTDGGTQTISSFNYVDLSGVYYSWTDGINGISNETFPSSSFVVATPVIIIAVYHQGSLLGMRINGTPVASNSAGGTVSEETGLTGFSIGVRGDFGSPAWDGFILETHVCAVQLSAAQCAQFEAYAAARYGIVI